MDYQVIAKYLATFLSAFVTTLILTPCVRRMALARGMVDMPDSRRIHKHPVPRLGGPAVFAGFHIACAVIFIPPWRPFFGSLGMEWWMKFTLLSSWILMLGIVDDLSGIRPWVKLAGQCFAAVMAFLFNMRFGLVLGVQMPLLLDLAITVFWILAITNAFNLIDGMDGVAAGLALIAAAGMAGGLLLRHQPADVMVLLGLIGACAAFLRYNFHPASIFLGDSGSMFLGFALAVIALNTGSKGAAMASIGVPLLAVGVPLFDTMLAVWRRFVRGLLDGPAGSGRIMRADMEHIHHRLTRSGWSQRRVAVILYVFSFMLVAVALMGLFYKTHAMGIYLVAFVAGVYVVVKHLARVELWDSGSAILHGLRRPTGRVTAVLLLPLLDVLSLSGCLLLALCLARFDCNTFAKLKYAWLEAWPIWVGISFIFLFAGRIYRRVWSRARISELLELWAALLAGGAVSLALTFVLGGGGLDRPVILQALLYLGFAMPVVAGLRIMPRLLQDLLAFSARHPSLPGSRNLRHVLVYGAGERGTLFLRYRSGRYQGVRDRRHIVGFLDDDSNLHGRLVYGYPVLGSGDRFETLAERYKVVELVLAVDLSADTLRRIRAVAFRRNICLTQWRLEERPLSVDTMS